MAEDGGRVEGLEGQLAAARKTIEVLTRRVERLDGDSVDESGALERALQGMSRELARRTRTLAETEATYQALYESSPDPLFTVDPLGVVCNCNRTAIEWLGYRRSEVVGRPLADLFDQVHNFEVERLAATGWAGVAERRFSLLDGRTVTLNGAPVSGAPLYHLTLRDVTTRHVLDEAERQRRRLESLADLAGSVARELNDPMSIVQGRLELVREIDDMSRADLDRHLDVALEHARRISATLHNLRLVGRTAMPRLKPVFLADAFAEALDLIGPRRHRLPIALDVDPPDLAAGGETAVYVRVFATLIGWTLDQVGRGGDLHVSGRLKRGEVVVRITGGAYTPPGREVASLPPAAAVEVASSFGLSVAETMVETLGGRVEVRRAGGTTMFTLRLPPAPAQRTRARPHEATLLVVGGEELESVLRTLLQREGFELEGARTAEQALEVIDDPTYDAVVTELLLPTMSGLTLAGEVLRRRPDLEGKVVLVSDTRLDSAPSNVVPLAAPLRRDTLLEALGRRRRTGRNGGGRRR